jgi:hypothetical protein
MVVQAIGRNPMAPRPAVVVAAWCWWAASVAAALVTGHVALVAAVVVAPVAAALVASRRVTLVLAAAASAAAVVVATVDGWTPPTAPVTVVVTTLAASVLALAVVRLRLADQAALGVARRSSQRERRRRRAVESRTRLYRLAAEVAACSSVQEVAATTFGVLLETTGADAALLGLLDDATEPAPRIRMVHAVGYREGLLERWPHAPLTDDLPATVALHDGAAVFAEDATVFAAQWPAVASDVVGSGFGALCLLPLLVSSRPVGFMVVSWREPRVFDDDDRQFLQALADQFAQAVERARLAEEEERGHRRLAFLGEVTRLVGASLDSAAVAERVTELVVATMADACAVLVADAEAGGALKVSAQACRDARSAAALHTATRLVPARRSGVVEVVDGVMALYEPLRGPGVGDGCLVYVSGVTVPVLGRQDAVLAREVAARTSTALDNATRYERERHIASVLQRAALPEHLPELPGVVLDAVYRAGTAGAQVGGDWYDALVLDDGRVLLSAGDVMGKGAAAAALMHQARTAIRAYAVLDSRPSVVLDRLDRLMAATKETRLVSAVVGVLDPAAGTVLLASAGHPPPVVVGPGRCEVVELGRRRLLGVPEALWAVPDGGAAPGHEEDADPEGEGSSVDAGECGTTGRAAGDTVVRLEVGDTLVLYSDGLVERRGETLDAGIGRLAAMATARLGRGASGVPSPAAELVDLVLGDDGGDGGDGGGGGDGGDDVVVMTVTVSGPVATTGRAPTAGDEAAAWIILPPEPTSVAVARRWVAAHVAAVAASRVGTSGGVVDRLARSPDDRLGSWAALLTSEVVTNAVLHARTDIGIGVRVDGAVVHVEVCDQSTVTPRARPFGVQASTGRGLVLVDRLATRWGVEERVAGKVVWFDVPLHTDGPPPRQAGGPGGRPGAGKASIEHRGQVGVARRGGPDGAGQQVLAGGPPAPPVGPTPLDRSGVLAEGEMPAAPGVRTAGACAEPSARWRNGSTPRDTTGPVVRLLGIPTGLAVDTSAHYAGLGRELQVHASGGRRRDGLDSEWSWRRLAALGAEVDGILGPVTARCARARHGGERVLDVEVAVDVDAARACRDLNEMLDEIEQWCRQGRLLAVAAPEPLVAYRRWLLHEVVHQVEGHPPRPWSGSDW